MQDQISTVNTNENISTNTSTSTSTANSNSTIKSESTNTSPSDIEVAQINGVTQAAVENTRAAAQVQVAQIETSNQVAVAQINAQAQISSAEIESNSRVTVSINEQAASNYRADQELAGINTHEAAETNRLNIKLAFAEAKFEEALSLATSVTGTATDTGNDGGQIGFHAMMPSTLTMGPSASSGSDFVVGAGSGVGYYNRRPLSGSAGHGLRMGSGDVKTGGIGFATGTSVADAVAATQLPFISTEGVLTPAKIQSQVNGIYARSDAKTQTELRRLTSEMVGRGFSSASPILSALQAGMANANIRSSIEGANQLRVGAAQANRGVVLDAQKAASDQYLGQEKILLDDEANQIQRTVGVLNAVASMVSGIL